MRKNNYLIPLILNIVLVILCSIGIFLSTKEVNVIFEYYTLNSNLLCLISSLLFVVTLSKTKNQNDVPYFVVLLRYIATCCLTLTFIIVVIVLIPFSGLYYIEGIKHFLLTGSMLYCHFLTPLLSIICFIFFEGDRRLNKKKTIWLAIIPTFIYGIILMILNILKVVIGPYPFLMVYNQAWYVSIIWIIIIFVVNYLLARYILLFNQMKAPRIRKVTKED